jgi:CRISPR-associated Cas5-like protein
MRTYAVQMEIAGPLAYFGDPASGAAFQTYLMPPSSAVEGMFRAIAFLRDGAYIRATRVELCSPLKLVNIVTNYRGPYRKTALMSQGNSQQLAQVCLQDVCYRLYGEAVANRARPRGTCALPPGVVQSPLEAWTMRLRTTPGSLSI